MAQRKLTPKQKQFVAEYLVDLNGTKAAERAGYSAKSANEQAARLLAKASVQEALQRALAKREQRTEITQDRVLREIAKIAFADIKDFLAFRTERQQVAIDPETGEPVFDNRPVIIVKPSEEVDGSQIGEVSISPRGVFMFKLHDKSKHLELLARHLGMLKEPEVNVTVNVDLAQKIKEARERVARGSTSRAGDNGDPGGTATD